MKTAYELAMERLGKTSPARALTSEQKKALGELDARYKARIAEREIALQSAIAAAEAGGDLEALEKTREQLATDRRKLQQELEQKKEQIRQQAG